MNMKPYKINWDNGRMCVVMAKGSTHAKRRGRQEVRGRFGEPPEDYDPEIVSVTLATEDDIAWLKAMDGVILE